jgi:hypothetical protein
MRLKHVVDCKQVIRPRRRRRLRHDTLGLPQRLGLPEFARLGVVVQVDPFEKNKF